jgi:hypothetical protein
LTSGSRAGPSRLGSARSSGELHTQARLGLVLAREPARAEPSLTEPEPARRARAKFPPLSLVADLAPDFPWPELPARRGCLSLVLGQLAVGPASSPIAALPLVYASFSSARRDIVPCCTHPPSDLAEELPRRRAHSSLGLLGPGRRADLPARAQIPTHHRLAGVAHAPAHRPRLLAQFARCGFSPPVLPVRATPPSHVTARSPRSCTLQPVSAPTLARRRPAFFPAASAGVSCSLGRPWWPRKPPGRLLCLRSAAPSRAHHPLLSCPRQHTSMVASAKFANVLLPVRLSSLLRALALAIPLLDLVVELPLASRRVCSRLVALACICVVLQLSARLCPLGSSSLAISTCYWSRF